MNVNGSKKIDSIFNPQCNYIKNAKITRAYFDYYLNDLSSIEKYDKFITLCEKLITTEMCPKLDRINEYAEDVDENKKSGNVLFYGQDLDLSTVAFRICTKSNWQKQFETDMKNLTDFDDGSFSKLYFFTNQDIVPKIIFNNEIKYLNSSKVEAHLFDRKWIIDKIFEHENYMMIAMEVFGLSKDLTYNDDIVSCASMDKVLNDELNALDELFDNYINGIEDSTNNEDNKAVEINWKELNKSLTDAFTIIDKLYTQQDSEDKKNKKYDYLTKYKIILDAVGTQQQKVDFIFESSWYMAFNEYDVVVMNDYATEICDILVETKNPKLFEKCVILWVLLRKNGVESKDTKKLLDKLDVVYKECLEDERDIANKLQVMHAHNFLSLYTKSEKETILGDYLKVLTNESNKYFDAYRFAILFTEDRNYYTSNLELIENSIDNIINTLKTHQVSMTDIGKIWFKQAYDIYKSKPKEAMLYFREAIKCFAENEDGRYFEALTLYYLGKIYSRKKLFWLARTSYINGLTKCINLYEKHAISSKLFLNLTVELKNVELSLGRIMYSTRFNYFEQIVREINNDEVVKSENSQDSYDFSLAVLIYKTPLIKLEQIGKVSRYFEKNGLYYSNIAVKHELGHYDKKLLLALDNKKELFDEYVSKWKQQPVKSDMEDVQPWYGVEYKAHFKMMLMNCEVELDVENKAITLEYATLLIGALQSILYDASATETQQDHLKIYVLYDKNSMFNINVASSKEIDSQFVVKIGRFSNENLASQADMLKAHLKEFVSAIVSSIFRYKTSYNKIKSVIDSEQYKERMALIAQSFVNTLDTFGFNTFNYNTLTMGYDNILSKRNIDDVFPNQNLSKKIAGLKKRLRVNFEQSEAIHEKIMNNVIDISLWDEAGWESVAIPNKAGTLPMFALLFKNEKGKEIFDNWIDKYSNEDKINYIGIRVLKKIESREPFKFRVVIGNTRKIYPEEGQKEIATPVYTCTVSAENVAKLYTFEKLLKSKTDYILCPAFYNEDGKIVYDYDRQIVKKYNSIKIFNAWELDMKDNLSTEGIFSTDMPVIPQGEDCVSLIKLIDEKKRKVDVLNAAMDMIEE